MPRKIHKAVVIYMKWFFLTMIVLSSVLSFICVKYDMFFAALLFGVVTFWMTLEYANIFKK